ncbi:MAG: hypothetical protein WC369_00075 [Dehalococcoidales bacterium]|jgi:predicted nucleic acid-binding protein
MSRVRKIYRNLGPGLKNYYVIDACFLANKFIPPRYAPDQIQKDRIEACLSWWKEIDNQLKYGKARIYISDVCIAEAFKVLAKKYYSEHWFKGSIDFNNARNKLARTIQTSPRALKGYERKIKYHDISTCRDIIISVDRFYELFMKHKKNVQIGDLILAATAKYLIDFYDIPRDKLHIITLDKRLYEGIKKASELQNVYDPTIKSHSADRVFTDLTTNNA